MGRRVYGAYTGLEYGTVSSSSTHRSPDAAGKLRFIVRTYYRLRRWSGLNMRPQANIILHCVPTEKETFLPETQSVSRIADRLSG
jgi:hypothetical protein